MISKQHQCSSVMCEKKLKDKGVQINEEASLEVCFVSRENFFIRRCFKIS